MRDIEFIKKIENLFQKYYEKTVSELREVHPQFGGMTNTALIQIQDDYLISEIRSRNSLFNVGKLSAYQNEEYEKALIQQLFYVLTEGDFRTMSGYDIVSNTFLPQNEMKKRYICSAAKQTLTNAGLFYPAMNGGVGRSFRRRC